MSVTTDSAPALMAALGLPAAERCTHVGSVADAATLLTEAARADAQLLWLHGGSFFDAGKRGNQPDGRPRWLGVLRPLRHCTPVAVQGSVVVVDVGGGRLWNELDASLRRRGAQLGRWQERLGPLPVGAALGRSAVHLDRGAREGWRVQTATYIVGGAIVEMENPDDASLARADAVLQVRLAVQPLRRSAGRQWWRFSDVSTALRALRTLGPDLIDGLSADLAPAVGLRRGAVWTRATDDGSTWRTAIAASLPGAAAFLDRRLRLAERLGWWLRLTCDGEPGVVEVRLAACATLLRESGGHHEHQVEADGMADWWPDAQPQVPQVAAARGANAEWSERQLDWSSLQRALTAVGAARAWLQVGDSNAVGARLQQWCIEERPLVVEPAESGGERIGRAVGPRLREALHARRRSGVRGDVGSSDVAATAIPLRAAVDALPSYLDIDEQTGCLWVTVSTPWRVCADRASSFGRTPASV